jgi:small subunit ribosomal protein S11
MAAKTAARRKGKGRKRVRRKTVTHARIYIKSSYNNTIVTVTDPHGNVLTWSSAGRVGFDGTKKSTPFAAQEVMRDAMEKAKAFGVREAAVFVKGIGSAREAAIRSIATHGIAITSIRDITPLPHDGCRPPKPRRV